MACVWSWVGGVLLQKLRVRSQGATYNLHFDITASGGAQEEAGERLSRSLCLINSSPLCKTFSTMVLTYGNVTKMVKSYSKSTQRSHGSLTCICFHLPIHYYPWMIIYCRRRDCTGLSLTSRLLLTGTRDLETIRSEKCDDLWHHKLYPSPVFSSGMLQLEVNSAQTFRIDLTVKWEASGFLPFNFNIFLMGGIFKRSINLSPFIIQPSMFVASLLLILVMGSTKSGRLADPGFLGSWMSVQIFISTL